MKSKHRLQRCLQLVAMVAAPVAVALFLFDRYRTPYRPSLTTNDKIRMMYSRSRSDMRSAATALESYFIDNGAYPISGKLIDRTFWKGKLRKSGGGDLPSFPIHPIDKAATITDPIHYITEVFPDPFAPIRNLTFVYYEDENGWIQASCGPDGDYDLVPSRDYDSSIRQPSDHLLATVTFDATNGIVSDGDIWRVKE